MLYQLVIALGFYGMYGFNLQMINDLLVDTYIEIIIPVYHIFDIARVFHCMMTAFPELPLICS